MARSLLCIARVNTTRVRAGLPLTTFLTFHRVRGRVKVRSFFGWTSGLRAVIGGRMLPCGCLTGTYEVWTGEVIAVVDNRGPQCTEHEDHLVLTG